MLCIYGEPKYLLKCESTFIEPHEHWWAIIDKEGNNLVKVPMTPNQVTRLMKKDETLEIISSINYFNLIKRDSKGGI